LTRLPEPMFERAELRRLSSTSRSDFDRALAGRAFSVDEIACVSAAQVLQTLRVETPARESGRCLATELLYRISLAAICHTINWDFLAERLARAFDEGGIDSRVLCSVTARDVHAWLDGYHRPERIRAKERAAFLRDLGNGLLRGYSGDAARVLLESGGHLYGPGGFFERLDEFGAFREDPLRKKSNVLVHEIVRDHLATFQDQDKIVPAIDYHIMRLYLRSGRVVPLHRETFELLKRDSLPRPRLVKLLREAVSKAVSLTALYAKMSVPEVNGLEWHIGRDVCDRVRPGCTDVRQLSRAD
jgi:hypothetical protein